MYLHKSADNARNVDQKRKNRVFNEKNGFSLQTLNSLPKDKFFDWSKLKALADNKIKITEKSKFLLGRVENIVVKGENAGGQHFLLFPHCFQKAFFFKGP